jgi:hypothetical protein
MESRSTIAYRDSPTSKSYDSEARAVLTLPELERWLALQIAGVYHLTVHSALSKTPVAAWFHSTEITLTGRRGVLAVEVCAMWHLRGGCLGLMPLDAGIAISGVAIRVVGAVCGFCSLEARYCAGCTLVGLGCRNSYLDI